ncbi:Odorant receptor 50 [Frankliniella occidentalis]|nr:Odorant receptor 50 [Frankliniella occidentalis]
MEQYLSEWLQHMGDQCNAPQRPLVKILKLLRESLDALNTLVRRSRFVLWRIYPQYAAAVYVAVLLAMLLDGSPNFNLWLYHHSMVLWIIKWLCAVASMSCAYVTVFTVMFVELAIHTSAAALMEQVGHRLSQKRGMYETVRSVRIHVMLLAACQQANAMFGLLLPLYHLGSFAISLLSTVSVVRGGVTDDLYATACASYIFAFFVPMCFAGQRVQDAGTSLSTRGPWPEEDITARRARLQIMVSCGRPVRFMVPGMPTLNLPTCRKGFRSWFQFIQVLINIQSAK